MPAKNRLGNIIFAVIWCISRAQSHAFLFTQAAVQHVRCAMCSSLSSKPFAMHDQVRVRVTMLMQTDLCGWRHKQRLNNSASSGRKLDCMKPNHITLQAGCGHAMIQVPTGQDFTATHILTSMKVSSKGSLASFLGVPGHAPAGAEVLGTPDVPPSPCATAALPASCLLLPLVLAVMPGTMTSRVRRGMCKSPAVTWGATATDRSALGLQAHMQF